MPIPIKVADRLVTGLKRFKPVVEAAKSRDVNEADTVTIVSDILSEMFGFDKFKELTHELCIKGTLCDLAVRIEDKLRMIIEVKRVNAELKESHVNQVEGYAVKQGIKWVAVTNAHRWKVYKVMVSEKQRITSEPAFDIDLSMLDYKDGSQMETLYLLTRESVLKSGLDAYFEIAQVVNKFMLAAALLSEPIVQAACRLLRRVSPGIHIEPEDIEQILRDQVLKREVTEGEKADDAEKKMRRVLEKVAHAKKEKEEAAIGVPSPMPQGQAEKESPPPQKK